MTLPDPAQLTRVAAQVQEAQNAAGFAWQLSQRYHRATTDEARAELVTKAGQEARKALDASRDALEALQDAGAVLPDRHAAPVASNHLAELAHVESSRTEALALLEGLKALLPVAENLDVKRGDVFTQPVNGYRGTEWNDRLVQMCSELELELFGPGEAVTGARE